MKISFQAGCTPVELTIGGLNLSVQTEQNVSARVTLEIREQDMHEEQPVQQAESPAAEMPDAPAPAVEAAEPSAPATPESPASPVLPEYLPPEAEQDLIELLKELNASNNEE